MKSFILMVAGVIMVAIAAFLSVAPVASAHYDADADVGEAKYLDPECVAVDEDPVAERDGGKIVLPGGTTEADINDLAPNGYVVHEVDSEGKEHYHRNTQATHECWIKGIVTIPTVRFLFRTAGGVLLFVGVLTLVFKRMSGRGAGGGFGGGGGRGGSAKYLIIGLMLILTEQVLLPFVFWCSRLAESVFEAVGRIF